MPETAGLFKVERPLMVSYVVRTCVRCSQDKPASSFYARGADLRGDCKACIRKRDSVLRQTQPHQQLRREQRLLREYGLTEAEFKQMIAAQGGACGICQRLPDEDPGSSNRPWFRVDHDHKTGEVRGLLCNQCNLGLGCLGDGAWLEAALKYIQASAPK